MYFVQFMPFRGVWESESHFGKVMPMVSERDLATYVAYNILNLTLLKNGT